MGMHIDEALQLPIMQQTKLIAGKKGLQNWIKWVTIVEVIEDIHRLQEGEFLITTGFGLTDNEEKQREFEKLLSLGKLSGVALYTGFYLTEIPQSFITIADQYALPLIEIPANINFSMITKELLVQIVNKQSQTFEYSLRIHQDFTRLVLEQQGFDPITKTLSKMIDASVILTEREEVISFCTIHDFISVDDQANLLQKQLDNFVVSNQPIVANKTIYGNVLVIKEKERWNELDSIAIEHATTVYATEFLRKKAVEETQLRLTSDFLEEILNQITSNTADVIERGKKLGIDFTNPQTIIYVYFPSIDKKNVRIKYNELADVIQSTLKQAKIPFLMRTKSDSIIALIEAGHNSSSLDTAKQVLKDWELISPKEQITIGIGKTTTDLHQLAESAKQAEQAAHFSNMLFKPQPIAYYDNFDLYQLLLEMKDSGINLKDFCQKYLGNLLGTRGIDFLTTLEAYLFYNQNIQQTANELYIHRHTLKYRLGQIEKKTGLTLNSYNNCTKLYLAIMAYKLLRDT